MKIKILALVTLMVSCLPAPTTEETEVITTGTTGGETTVTCTAPQILVNGVCVDDTSSGGGYVTPGTGATCTGTTADSGTGETDNFGFPKPSINIRDVFLAGGQAWTAKKIVENADSTNMDLYAAKSSFVSDSRLRVRFKVNAQRRSTGDEVFCYGRRTDQSLERLNYSKIWLRVGLRDIYWTGEKDTSSLEITSMYAPRYIGPIDVDSCSPIIDFGSTMRKEVFVDVDGKSERKIKAATVVVLDDARDDVACQTNGTLCNGGRLVTSKMCWGVTLQFSTDATQDFN